MAISALLHVPSTLFPRLYFYIAAGIFTLSSVAEGGILLCYNRILARGKDKMMSRVGEIFKYLGEDDSPVQVTIFPKEPLEMKAGQYINICIPSLGVWSFMQSHPFVVTSWTGKQQTKLELIIEPRRGWTKKLHSRAITASGQSGGLGRVLFTGPHGVPVPVDEYEYVIMVVSGYGIVAHLPLLERLVQGTLAREVRARRICLVWEFEDIGEF
jgi:NAD(P)H-flavin reductase